MGTTSSFRHTNILKNYVNKGLNLTSVETTSTSWKIQSKVVLVISVKNAVLLWISVKLPLMEGVQQSKLKKAKE